MRDSNEATARQDAGKELRPVELVFAVDDEDAPTEVTAFPRHGHDDTTAWITMDVGHVVDLADHA